MGWSLAIEEQYAKKKPEAYQLAGYDRYRPIDGLWDYDSPNGVPNLCLDIPELVRVLP